MSVTAGDNSDAAGRNGAKMESGVMRSRLPRHRTIAPAWVLVAGDFHREGGMDRANAEFAAYLCAAGVPVHLVSYRVDSELAAHSNVQVHLARRIAGAHFLAQRQLDRLGRAVAAKVIAHAPGARVLVNGVNCEWPDINWVHYVHQEWLTSPSGAPLWFRLKHGIDGYSNSRKELRVLKAARIVIANSERTRSDLIRDAGVAPERVRTVYLGCGLEWRTITPERRAAARYHGRFTPARAWPIRARAPRTAIEAGCPGSRARCTGQPGSGRPAQAAKEFDDDGTENPRDRHAGARRCARRLRRAGEQT